MALEDMKLLACGDGPDYDGRVGRAGDEDGSVGDGGDEEAF